MTPIGAGEMAERPVRYFSLASSEHPDHSGEPLNSVEFWVSDQCVRLEADPKSDLHVYATSDVDVENALEANPLVKEISKPKPHPKGDA